MKTKIFTLALLLLTMVNNNKGQVSFRTETTENSISYYLENSQNISSQLSATARFREVGGSWRECIKPSTVDYKNGKLITGSVVQLNPNTQYEVELIVKNLITNTNTIYNKRCTTIPIFVQPLSKDTLWISTNGTGSTYTNTQPGNITDLFRFHSSKLDSGTCVIFKSGTYYVGDIKSFNLFRCNSKDFPITFMAEANGTVILDGSENNKSGWDNWILYDTINKIYKATLSSSVAYSTGFFINGKRLFPYSCIYNISLLGSVYRESLKSLWYGSGFFRNGNIFFVKMADGSSPKGKEITASRCNYLFNFTNVFASKQTLIFKNLTIKNYGKPIINNDLSVIDACAIKINDIQNVVLDNCKFENNSSSVVFYNDASGTRIQNCTFKNQTGHYSQMAYKNTSLPVVNNKSHVGRNLELHQIYFKSEKPYNTLIIKNNVFDDVVFSIVGDILGNNYSSNIDVYNNKFIHNFDPIGGFGTSINYRVWNNYFSNNIYNFSPVCNTIGPIYVFRNVFDSIIHRRGYNVPPNTVTPATPSGMFDCNWNYINALQGSLFKWRIDLAACSAYQYFDFHFYHNTVLARDTFAMNLRMVEGNCNFNTANNVYYSTFKNMEFDAKLPDSDFSIISNNDNFFSATNELAEIVKPNPGNNNPCEKHNTLTTVKTRLRTLYAVLDTNQIQFNNSYMYNPLFISNADYHLQNNSPLINKGIIISNISDLAGFNYFGSAPDIGAFETANANKTSAIDIKSTHIFPNPNKGNFTVVTQRNCTYYIYNTTGQLLASGPLVEGSNSIHLGNQISAGNYFLKTTDGMEIEMLPFIIMPE